MINRNIKTVPDLRFPEFKEKWQTSTTKKLFNRISDKIDVEHDKYYQEIGIRSHGKGIFHKEPVLGIALGNKRVFWIKENVFILNIVFAWEQAVAKTSKRELGMIASHRFPMFEPKKNNADLDYFLFFFLTKKGKHLLGLASPGGAGRNKTLGQKTFDDLKIIHAPYPEQKKIASFLSSIDKKIELLTQKKELLDKYKKGVMQKIFSQEIRFKYENGIDYPAWEEKKLESVLSTISTRKYQIKSTEIIDKGKIPVIDQGKRYIAGFSDNIGKVFKNKGIIVFGDHTTILKFIDFDFIVGADGTKLLTTESENLKYIFYNALFNNVKSDGYKRHYSILKNVYLQIPCLAEQKKIADFLSSIDKKIELVQTQLTQTQTFKKGLLQRMFV